MAESEAKSTIDQRVEENESKSLKYLDFVQISAIYVMVWCSTLYEYAKENSGPLRPGVQTVEGTVKAVIGPVYQKFHDVPSHLLIFLDRKVDESLTKLDGHVPLFAKQLASQTWVLAQKAPQAARELAYEVQRAGLVETGLKLAKNAYDKYEPTAKELYDKYEPVAEQHAVVAWLTLNQLPLFPQLAHLMVPTAAYWADKYNQAVAYTAQRGYTISYYLPLVPIDRIAKIFDGAENEPNGQYVAVSQ